MRNQRSGLGLIEVAAALVLLSALATLVAQIVTWSAVERRACQRREIAVAEAANAMERLAVSDAKSLKPHATTEISLSPVAKNMLPSGKLTSEIQEAKDPPDGKRIVIELNWLNQAGEPELPVRLVTWVWR